MSFVAVRGLAVIIRGEVMSMVYTREIRELLEACEYKATIYEREPVREEAKIRRMTPRERSQVERMSYPEQGYRRFRAERMTVI